MKQFLGPDFLLDNAISKLLYFDYAQDAPIIDYHNHLSPKDVANNRKYENISQAWLEADHYKWRAMRANGISEKYITGSASDPEKFEQWAKTVPYTLRNPLYHWTHLELQRYFEISDLLNKDSAAKIYGATKEQLQEDSHSTQGLLRNKNVSWICTTDDPLDSLAAHRAFATQGESFKMLPGFRPDRFLKLENENYITLVEQLGDLVNGTISNVHDLVAALYVRIEVFHEHGCRIADHGLSHLPAAPFNDDEVNRIFLKRLDNQKVYPGEAMVFQSGLLYYLGRMYHDKGWVMQFHLGPIRNNNDRLIEALGADAGCDSIGDYQQAPGLSFFLNKLDGEEKLAKTIIYNSNPRDNHLFATMAGNFNNGEIPGKIQWGAAWWFMDEANGIKDHLEILSATGLLRRFVGMLTDSRSFLSIPRHEYFRRILCHTIGTDVQEGRLPDDIPLLGEMIGDICYQNAADYFGIQ